MNIELDCSWGNECIILHVSVFFFLLFLLFQRMYALDRYYLYPIC